MDRRDRIESRLRDGLAASHVDVEDESHLHAGHAGAKEGGGHFRATIVSERFDGLGRVARQRLVFDLLADEMRGDIHALSMRTFTADEWAEADG
ncbi:MAG: BolA family protein [Myxococcota bacterium]